MNRRDATLSVCVVRNLGEVQIPAAEHIVGYPPRKLLKGETQERPYLGGRNELVLAAEGACLIDYCHMLSPFVAYYSISHMGCQVVFFKENNLTNRG